MSLEMLAGKHDGSRATTLTEGEIARLVPHYEGLVCRTAQLVVTGEHPECSGRAPVELEEDDVRQILWMKVLYMLRRYDPSKVVKKQTSGTQRYGSTTAADKARDSYVNMGTRDAVKDLVKKKRRNELFIEDVAPGEDGYSPARNKFEAQYLSEGQEHAFSDVEDEMPALPNTLAPLERKVVALMFESYRQTEIAVMLDVSKRDVESAVRGIRIKLADWIPARS